jgi:ArsR family transcriptional regulator
VSQTIAACCEPVCESALDPDQAKLLAGWFRLLADPARLRLFSLIASRGEVCACELVEPLGVSQPTVSYHLNVLHRAGLLDREKRGRQVYYQAAPERLAILSRALLVKGAHPTAGESTRQPRLSI